MPRIIVGVGLVPGVPAVACVEPTSSTSTGTADAVTPSNELLISVRITWRFAPAIAFTSVFAVAAVSAVAAAVFTVKPAAITPPYLHSDSVGGSPVNETTAGDTAANAATAGVTPVN